MYTYIYIEIDIDIDRAVISVISQLGGMTIVTTDRMFIAIEKKIDGYNYGYPLWSSPEGISYYNRQRNMMATTMVTNGLQVRLYMYSVHILRYIYIHIHVYVELSYNRGTPKSSIVFSEFP